MKPTKKVIKAWAIVKKGKILNGFYNGALTSGMLIFPSKIIAEAVDVNLIEGELVIPCTITYTLPKRKGKRG